jgi:hypothetical protein
VLSSKYRPHDQINKNLQPREPNILTKSEKKILFVAMCVKNPIVKRFTKLHIRHPMILKSPET